MTPNERLMLAAAVAVIAAFCWAKRRRRRKRNRDPTNPWSLDAPVLRLNRHDVLTLADLTRGALFLSGIGGGKTSSAKHLALGLLKLGCSFTVLTCKPGDFEMWRELARKTGREKDLYRFAPDETDAACDLMMWETSRPGVTPESVAAVIQQLMEIATRTQSGGSENQFWEAKAILTIQHAVRLLMMAYGGSSLLAVYAVVMEAPGGVCAKALNDAEKLQGDSHDFMMATRFWRQEWGQQMTEKVKGTVQNVVTNTLMPLLMGEAHNLVAGGRTTVTPSDVIDKGLIFVCDCPTLVWGETGRLIQAAMKVIISRECLRRRSRAGERPCVIWADEAHQHALRSFDPLTQAVARENRIISVALVQSLEMLGVAFGRDSKQAVEAWTAGLSCKFIGANSSTETNDAMSRLIGKTRKLYFGGGPQNDFDLVDEMLGTGKGAHAHFNEQLQYIYEPSFFSGGELRTGGVQNGLWVDMILHLSGKRFSNGLSHMPVSFKQE